VSGSEFAFTCYKHWTTLVIRSNDSTGIFIFSKEGECVSGSEFAFTCYQHWSTLMIRSNDTSTGVFIFSKEGATQGDQLSMFAYGVGMLPDNKRKGTTIKVKRRDSE
jgi:hypothetical protein